MAPRDELLGKNVGGYVLRARIGSGATGAVYAAVHAQLRRRVAVKVLHGGAFGDARGGERLRDEARALAALQSEHIVAVHDLATLADGRLYLAMEYLEGESLSARRARRGGKLDPREAVALCAQALEGLAVAHAHGIVHGDVKPDNVFVAEAQGRVGVVKLLDFGFAGGGPRGAESAGSTPSGGDAPGQRRLFGTPRYMSPEHADPSRALDPRADLYGLAVVLYELVAGRPPFESESWAELLVLHRTAAPARLDPAVGEALERALLRALAKRPDERFASAEEMRRAIVDAVGGEASLPAIAPRPRRLGRARLVVALVTAALALALVALVAAIDARRGAASSASRAPGLGASATNAPGASATDERCDFEVTDRSGHVHSFGGPRAEGLTEPKRAFILFQRTDRLLVHCTEDFTGRMNQARVELSLPLRAADAGASEDHASISLSFVGMPPDGFEPGVGYSASLAPLLVVFAGQLAPARRVGTSPEGLPLIHYEGWGSDWDGPIAPTEIRDASPPDAQPPLSFEWSEHGEREGNVIRGSVEAQLRAEPSKPALSLRLRFRAIE